MGLNVGDKVRMKSLYWYEQNINKNGTIEVDKILFIPEQKKFLDREVTIARICGNNLYKIEEDNGELFFSYNMFNLERESEFVIISKDGTKMMGHIFKTESKAREFLGIRQDYVIRELKPL